MKLAFQIRRRQREQGYIMMMLLLTMALMAIFAAAIVPEITFDIKRDREQEMIHRGVQYSRAIRAYYKKFGRYPMKIEDLENTNQLRFLRKRYKDPLTNKDFRLLHYGEAKLSLSGIGGGMIPGANPVGTNGGFAGPGTFAQPPALGNNNAFGGSGGVGASSNSAFGQSSQTTNQAEQTGQPGSDASQSPSAEGTTGTNPNGVASSSSGDKLSSTTFGGAPIVGVASLSKDPTIRIFDKKKKYNEWQFVYDPTMDRGLLITSPYQQQVGFGVMGTPNLNNQINGQNSGNSGFGSPGMQNTTSPANNGFGNTSQPTDIPVQK